MSETSLTDLQKMLRNLPSNSRNAEFLLKLGEIYYNLTSGSSTDITLDEQVKISALIDWQSHHASIKYALLSFKLNPTIDSALLIMNSFNSVGNYSAALDFIVQQKLLERFPNESFTIASVLLYSLSKKGMLFQSVQLLYELFPDFFKTAQQNLETLDESPQRNFQRISRANNPIVYYKGQNENGFLKFCEALLDNFQQQRNIQDNLAINVKWDFDYFFNTGIDLHKEGYIREAMQLYALAFNLNPLESKAEMYSLASLHLMGEHQVVLEKSNQFIERYPRQPWAYVVASNSCASINNLSGLESILSKSNKNNVKLSFLDLLIGFYLESKGQTKQAISFYKKNVQISDNDFISTIFNSRIERMEHE